jgi:hypothetical protein
LGLAAGRLSPGAEPLVALAGALDPFRRGADVLKRLAGLDVSAAGARRVTERAGRDLLGRHAAGQAVPAAPAAAWDFSLPDGDDGRAFPGTVAYVGLDSFAVPTRGGGGVAWRMLYVGLLYDPRKEHTVYLADFDHERVAALLRRYAIALRLGEAETVVALTDGGSGLEAALRRCFGGGLEFVLDFWHASEHLHAFAFLWHGRDSPAAREWAERAVGVMRLGGGARLLEWLGELTLPAGAGAEVVEALGELRGFVGRQAHRMDYPAYRARGWDIGSGPTEAGCKVLGGRLKGSGMRWAEAGSAEVAALRALYASGEGLWDAFWQGRTPTPKEDSTYK